MDGKLLLQKIQDTLAIHGNLYYEDGNWEISSDLK